MSLMSVFKNFGVITCLIGSVALAGCSSTGSSSSNTGSVKQKEASAQSAKASKKKSSKDQVSSTKKSKDKASAKKTEKAKPVKVAVLAQRPSEINRPTSGKISRTGEVYLLRGLANVFSRGMDVLGVRLVKKGVDARVYNHGAWRDLANNIIARNKRKQVSYPIIIMGHSLGGNASVIMAKYLGDRGVKVRYVVAFDPTITTFVGSNVKQVTNYYLPNDEHSNIVRKTPKFTGKLRNVKVTKIAGIKHTNVEKNRGLQNKSIQHIMSLTKKRRNQKKRRG